MIALGVINEEDYYYITVNEGEIILQGHISLQLIAKTELLFRLMRNQHDGFARFQKGNVKIILT